jgi:hypothetical protein
VLAGEAQISGSQYQPFVILCIKYLKRYGDGVKLIERALQDDPSLANDREERLRFRGASAALQACRNDPKASDKQRAEWRRQALEWLQAELESYRTTPGTSMDKQEGPGTPSPRESVRGWLQDATLAGVREADLLTQLPTSEQHDWLEFWGEVEEFLGTN